jgi:hypothetical protein
MPSRSSNNAVVASAGSGKTEDIVVEALAVPPGKRVLMTTFTDNGTNEIRSRIISKAGHVPENIDVMPWFTFLIRHGIKPYQTPVLDINELSGLFFDVRPGRPRKADPRRYYFSTDARVYRDYASEAIVYLNQLHGGAVIERISEIYQYIYYDELQDLSAGDFPLFELLLSSTSNVTLVGDPRQGTFTTAQSRTNRRFTGSGIMTWLEGLEARGLITIEHKTHSMRCNQAICDVADGLNPTMFETESRNLVTTGHDGVFLITEDDVEAYCAQFTDVPQVLTYDKNGKNFGLGSRNMGDVKGLTFDRVIISPAGPMANYFTKGTSLANKTKAKLYVGLTRARFSVAIVVSAPGLSDIPVWSPNP